MNKKFNFEKLLTSPKGIKAAIIIGIAAVLLILLSDLNPADNPAASESVNVDEQYITSVKDDVKELVKSITGRDDISVSVTLDSGTEYLYATKKSVNTDSKNNKTEGQSYNNEMSDKTEEEYIIINTDSGEEPLLISTVSPVVRGVAIVSKKGFSDFERQKIASAVSVLLDLGEDSVYIG